MRVYANHTGPVLVGNEVRIDTRKVPRLWAKGFAQPGCMETNFIFRRSGTKWRALVDKVPQKDAYDTTVEHACELLNMHDSGRVQYHFRGNYLNRVWSDPQARARALNTLEDWMESEVSFNRLLVQACDANAELHAEIGRNLWAGDGEVHMNPEFLRQGGVRAYAIIDTLEKLGLPVRCEFTNNLETGKRLVP